MEWRDQGALLSVRRHGETSAIVEVFTETHGRHLGVVRGGTSRKIAPILQPGAQLDVLWRARLEDHLGTYTIEPIRSRAAAVMADRKSLAGLNAVCALLSFALPEREPHGQFYQHSVTMLDLIGNTEAWPLAYLRWELTLLEEMGFGLDLTRCAVTGTQDDLAYVSPKTGRAVSAEAAGAWKDRLLALPPCLLGAGEASDQEIAHALKTTGFFLEHRLAPQLGDKPIPVARDRLLTLLNRQS